MEPQWEVTKDGDCDCYEMFIRHYSSARTNGTRRQKQFVGPGEKFVLRTTAGDAFFVWRKFIDDAEPPQFGINCAAFRNESGVLSSELIRQADCIADALWPCERHYTYVDSKKVRSRNPGYCFIMAGWRKCGFTKGGLLILEKVSNETLSNLPNREAAG